MYGVYFGRIFTAKKQNLHADRCLFFYFLVKKRLKVSLAKMVKKWLENLVMEIILFNTKNKRVPKIRLLRVVKKSALRLERANLANF